MSFRDEMKVNERERERHGVIKEWKKKKEGESGIILITEQNKIYKYIYFV